MCGTICARFASALVNNANSACQLPFQAVPNTLKYLAYLHARPEVERPKCRCSLLKTEMTRHVMNAVDFRAM